MLMMTFGERLKNLRKEAGLTQDELANRTHLSQTAISNWEAGNRIPSIDYAIILAKYFFVTLDYLCGLESD